jgi:RimJ/RimL family protein N-acetyltransferase
MKEIRRLRIGEGALYRSVRLASLRDSPQAFSSTYEDAFARDEEDWNAQADASALGSDRATFVVIDQEPCGLGAVYRDVSQPEVGELLQMWISAEHRGSLVATELLNEIFKWAALNGFSRIKAGVLKGNSRAIRFYRRFGFVPSQDISIDSDSIVMLTKFVEPDGADNGDKRRA